MECAVCSQEETELRCLKAVLCGMPTPEPIPDFERRLLVRVHACEAGAPPFKVVQFSSVVLVAGAAFAFTWMAVHAVAVGRHPSVTVQGTVINPEADLRRDQVYEEAASEPMLGAPVLTAADYGR